MKEFSVVCPIKCFPSDNVLESGKLKDRLALKKEIKDLAFGLAMDWIKQNNLKRWLLTAAKPFLTAPCVLTLTVHYADRRRRDIHNLSIKTFCDQIVALNIIKDDAIEFIPTVIFQFGGKSAEPFAVFSLKENNNYE